MTPEQRKSMELLVPLDGSRLGEQVLRAVPRFPAPDRRGFLLLEVVAPVNQEPLMRLDDSVAYRPLETRHSQANRCLEGVRTRMERRWVCAGALVRSVDPVEEILRWA